MFWRNAFCEDHDVSNDANICAGSRTHLLTPVLETLLTLRVTVLLVHEVQRDKRAHAPSDDKYTDDGIHPAADLVWRIRSLAALPVVGAVEGRALLVRITGLSQGLGLDAHQLL